MPLRIFLAGASGVIGRRLSLMLAQDGHVVAGTTRACSKADELRKLGVKPVIVDVMRADALTKAMGEFGPEIVIHQLTDLPHGLPRELMAEATAKNAKLREFGTRNLMAAAAAAGVRRVVAQSIAWAYKPGQVPHSEGDPLDLGAEGVRAIAVRGVRALELSVLNSSHVEGIVLRYGQLYGPGTGTNTSAGEMPLHVDAAAFAAKLAIFNGEPGVYNIAEPNTHVLTDKARSILGWNPDFRQEFFD